MSARLSSLIAAGLAISASAAHSQTAVEPPVIRTMPSPPLVVPITPAPLDEQTQTTLEAEKLRVYIVNLKHITPSLMAYWLDPKNHEAPAFNQTPFPSYVKDFSLPEGVDRIVAVDPQKTLLVFGSSTGAANLLKTIEFLDRPSAQSFANLPMVVYEASAYWFETNSAAAQQWEDMASIPRIAQPHQVEALKTHPDAAVQPFRWQTSQSNSTVSFPFEKLSASKPSDRLPRPRMGNGEKFNSLMPRFQGGIEIDPNFLLPPSMPKSELTDQVVIVPLETTNDSVRLSFSAIRPVLDRLTNVPTALSLKNNDTILLTRNAEELNLKPFKPNYGTVVLAITVHIAQPPTNPALPPLPLP